MQPFMSTWRIPIMYVTSTILLRSTIYHQSIPSHPIPFPSHLQPKLVSYPEPNQNNMEKATWGKFSTSNSNSPKLFNRRRQMHIYSCRMRGYLQENKRVARGFPRCRGCSLKIIGLSVNSINQSVTFNIAQSRMWWRILRLSVVGLWMVGLSPVVLLVP
jgi:hypothetical protein